MAVPRRLTARSVMRSLKILLDTMKEALEAAKNLEFLTGLTPPLTSMAKEEK